MDKIFSTRIDEAVSKRVTDLSRRLGISKKALIERAVRELAERIEDEEETDVFTETCGAWRREETAAETVRAARQRFGESMERHQS
jgi:predicted transcriptional regulator